MPVVLVTHDTRDSAMREALARSDASGLQMAAHTHKGSAGVLAAEEAQEVAAQIEEMARHGDLSRAREMVARLESELDKLMRALQALEKEH